MHIIIGSAPCAHALKEYIVFGDYLWFIIGLLCGVFSKYV